MELKLYYFNSYTYNSTVLSIEFFPDLEYIIKVQVTDKLQKLNDSASGRGYWMRSFIFGVLLSAQIIYGTDAGIEILKNGTFKNDSSWYLALNGDASAKHVFENNMLSVSIATPGSESWFIQLTQNRVNVKKDKIYVLSFEIKSSQARTILTSVCKDGGDYLPYSLRDTVKIDTSFLRYSQEFRMVQPTDSSARVEFNFGSFKGDIQLKNVSLMEYFEPKITFTGISPQHIAFSDEPIKLSWSSIGLQDTLKLSVSYDDGFSWTVIKSNLKAVDSLEWIPGATLSPWCLFKLATSKTSTITTTPFQIIPKIELISNGTFRNSYTGWTLSADTPTVQASMAVQNSTLIVSSSGTDTVILSQSSIALRDDDLYELFFTCHSKPSSILTIRLSNCIVVRPDQTSDTVEKTIQIESTPNRYSILFKAANTVSNGKLEFIMNKTACELSLSNISLVNASPPASSRSNAKSVSQINTKGTFRPVFFSGKTQSRIQHLNTNKFFNLAGRQISGKQLDPANHSFRGTGLVIIVPENNDHIKQTGPK